MKRPIESLLITCILGSTAWANDWIATVARPEKYDGKHLALHGVITLNGEGRNRALLWFDKAAADYGMHGYFTIDQTSLEKALADRLVVKNADDLAGEHVYMVCVYHRKKDPRLGHGLLVIEHIGLLKKHEYK